MLKFVFCLSLLLSTAAYAEDFPQTAPAPDAATAAETNMIVVTATRTLTLIDQVPASVTVLGKAAIDRAQDIGVSELLLRTPGVSLSRNGGYRSEEQTSELQSLMRISYSVFCLKKKTIIF